MPALTTDSQKVCFQRGLAATVGKSGFSDVTLITGDTEALGHGIFVDEKSVEGLMGLLMGKSLPGYLTHDGAMFGDRLGKEIGIFSGFYRDGLKLKAKTFRFLNAFIKNDVETYEKLVELAQELPEQFGLSVVFSGRLVWDMGEDGEVDADGPMPEGALRGMPSIRFSSVESADFVKAPAANPGGLFAKPVDGASLGMATETNSTAQTITLTAVSDATVSTAGTASMVISSGADAATEALSSVRSELASVKEQLAAKEAALAARDAELAKAKTDHAAALAAKDSELAATKAELETAKTFDMRRAGVPHDATPVANVTAEMKPKTTEEKWAHYETLRKSDALAAQKFYDENLRVLRR